MNLTEIEKQISIVAGVNVEIGVMANNNFSFCYEGNNPKAAAKIKSFFGLNATWTNEKIYDEEIDYTAIYATIN